MYSKGPILASLLSNSIAQRKPERTSVFLWREVIFKNTLFLHFAIYMTKKHINRRIVEFLKNLSVNDILMGRQWRLEVFERILQSSLDLLQAVQQKYRLHKVGNICYQTCTYCLMYTR